MSWDEAKYWRDMWHEELKAHHELQAAVLTGNGYEHLMSFIKKQITTYQEKRHEHLVP